MDQRRAGGYHARNQPAVSDAGSDPLQARRVSFPRGDRPPSQQEGWIPGCRREAHLDRQGYAVTANLRRGRFLLLILGDGVREDVEAIASYLQAHAGLHFTFGLVEFPIYRLPSGERLVAPRVVARTMSVLRTVVAAPEGFVVQEQSEASAGEDVAEDPDRAALAATQRAFWKEFLDTHLHLDDRSQSVPKPARQGYLAFMLPAPQGSSWLTVYRDLQKGEVGVFLSAS